MARQGTVQNERKGEKKAKSRTHGRLAEQRAGQEAQDREVRRQRAVQITMYRAEENTAVISVTGNGRQRGRQAQGKDGIGQRTIQVTSYCWPRQNAWKSSGECSAGQRESQCGWQRAHHGKAYCGG
jgi:hypothetical protein